MVIYIINEIIYNKFKIYFKLYEIKKNFFIIKEFNIKSKILKDLKVYFSTIFDLNLNYNNEEIYIEKYIYINLKRKYIIVYNNKIILLIEYILNNKFYILSSYSSIKEQKFITFNNKIEYYIGMEIEMDLKNNNLKNRKNIIKYIKKYKNILYSTTEDFNNCGIEINTFPCSFNILKTHYNLFNKLKSIGLIINPNNDIHFHVCSNYFGQTLEEKILNLNKICLFLYNNENTINLLRNYKNYDMYIQNPNIKTLIEYNNYNYRGYNFIEFFKNKYLGKRYYKNILIQPLLNFNKLFEDNFKSNTIEFRIFPCPSTKEEYLKQINFLNTILNIVKLPMEVVKDIKFFII